jgi:hypothetical protein
VKRLAPLVLASLASLASLSACSSSGAGAAGDGPSAGAPPGAAKPGASDPAASPAPAATDPGATATPPPSGPPPSALPFPFTRPDVGTPLTQAELDAATDELLALLADTRYFDVVDERIHGWPESDPGKGFWYGTWWSGVTIEKHNGQVTYRHNADGADNNGLRTAPYLEGACYAYLVAGKPLTGKLVRRIARGYTSWGLAMKRSASDTAETMLARAAYPASVTSNDGGRTIFIDYSADRPGIDNGATEYVHLTANPTFGDVFIKNKRSKDDMGQIFRSIAQIQACVPRLDAAAQADLAQTKAMYASWSNAVEAAGWSIATLDKSANVYTPPLNETLAHYTLFDNVECPGAMMMSLLGTGGPGSLGCGSGVSNTEMLTASQMKNGVRQILRTHHEAAVAMALVAGQNTVALDLLGGLAARLDGDVPAASQATPPANMNPTDIVSLVLQAANTGVPLTSREVRWVHQRLHTAYASYRAPSVASTYHVFDPATPDGTYSFDPPGDGIAFADLGVMLGSCASPWRNPAGRPLLDCSRLVAALSK